MERNSFLWGSATSAHQVEGNNTLNDWWEWERRGKLPEPSGLACDHYRRFKDDLKIAGDLAHTAHRFSLEWSRLEPEENRWDDDAWNHYKEVVATLRSMNIEPMVTLNHFTLPLWFYKNGGWRDRASVEHFRRFAKKSAEVLGENVTYWITINEPMVYAACSYLFGKWPPGISSRKDFTAVIEHFIRAHVRAYQIIHRTAELLFPDRRISVGIAKNIYSFDPNNPRSLADKTAARARHLFYNHLIISSCIRGSILFPGFRPAKLLRGNALDFIGINYYSRHFISAAGKGIFGLLGREAESSREREKPLWKNYLGWEIYPQGLYRALKDISRYKLPLIVTENGICTNDDTERVRFIKEHIDALLTARREGIPVFGYLYWSLLDNFEWSDGYAPRFGLVGVDYKTQERTIRQSAFFLSRYIQENILSLKGAP